MKKLFLLILFLQNLILLAQNPSFTWSESQSPIDNELNYSIQNYIDGKRIFKVKSIYNDKIFNKDVFVDIFSINDDFEKDESNFSISVDQPLMGKNMQTVSHLFYLNNKDYVYFLTEFNNETKDFELFTQKVNFDTGTKTKAVFLTKMPAKNMFNIGDYFIAQSENKQYYGVVSRPIGDKKLNEKVTLYVLDANFKIIKSLEHEFNFTTKQSFDIDVYVSNNGNVALTREIDLPKTKPFKTIYFWNKEASNILEYNLKQDLDFQVSQFKWKDSENGSYFFGGINDGKRKVTIDLGGALPKGNPLNTLLFMHFDLNGKLLLDEKINIEKQNNLNFEEVIIKDNKIWLLFNELYTGTKSLPAPDKTKPLERPTEYSYLSTGYSVIKLDATSGKLDWYTRINNMEPKTINDNGDHLKYLHFFRNNELILIYNDSRDININTKYYTKDSRFVVMSVINNDGKIINTKDISNSGVGKNYNFCYELDLSIALPIDQDTYVVRSRCGNSARYGFLKFN
ncbi:hypothetical protein [Flavobacterium cyclinae]|uniref:hypothetical protein n=1 Tax=Flavobacterium cyclinae TaxID=2895947 RepID=UPI001E424EEF|nr:hypothetical protein [Flavobacterium cyclinae]UGS21695.1 hypothetical protein LOS86_03465 [Flavobacterium cyclinae]